MRARQFKVHYLPVWPCHFWACSSVGQSKCLIHTGSKVRVLPGPPRNDISMAGRYTIGPRFESWAHTKKLNEKRRRGSAFLWCRGFGLPPATLENHWGEGFLRMQSIDGFSQKAIHGEYSDLGTHCETVGILRNTVRDDHLLDRTLIDSI